MPISIEHIKRHIHKECKIVFTKQINIIYLQNIENMVNFYKMDFLHVIKKAVNMRRKNKSKWRCCEDGKQKNWTNV